LSKKTKPIFIILAGLILVAIGIFASLLLIRRSQSAQVADDVNAEVVKTTVVVLTKDLSLGDRIEADDVTLTSVPIEIAPRDVMMTLEDVVGKIIKTDLVQGEMVLLHNLADPTNNNYDLSFVLADDHVLMAFPAEDLLSRESMVKRGDIVDIFATFTEEVKTVGDTGTTAEDTEPQLRTFTVDTMQNVNITALILEVIEGDSDPALLGTGGGGSAPTTAPDVRAYLLALNPQDALILKHLKDTDATFDFVLRSPTSNLQFDLTPVTEEYIIEYYGLEILP
jgi:pilus assembly protein CpaB